MQSLIGPLIFACSVFVPGRSFLRRLIDLTWGVKNQKALKILQTNRKQISIFGFCYCYSRENLYFILKIGFQEIIYYLFTDDSRAFCFCCCNGLQWFVSYWQESMKATKLLSKSCIQLVWPWRIGGGRYKKLKVFFMFDSLALVLIINKHTPGKRNIIADRLSRF